MSTTMDNVVPIKPVATPAQDIFHALAESLLSGVVGVKFEIDAVTKSKLKTKQKLRELTALAKSASEICDAFTRACTLRNQLTPPPSSPDATAEKKIIT